VEAFSINGRQQILKLRICLLRSKTFGFAVLEFQEQNLKMNFVLIRVTVKWSKRLHWSG